MSDASGQIVTDVGTSASYLAIQPKVRLIFTSIGFLKQPRTFK